MGHLFRSLSWRWKATFGPLLGAVLAAAGALVLTSQAQPAPPIKRFDFSLSAGRLTSGERTVRVTKGDIVELHWRSDRVIELHLHGYDLQVKVGPSGPQIIKFESHATGRFPVEIHGNGGRHTNLIYVEVHPR